MLISDFGSYVDIRFHSIMMPIVSIFGIISKEQYWLIVVPVKSHISELLTLAHTHNIIHNHIITHVTSHIQYSCTCNKPGDSDGSFLPLPGALPAARPPPLPLPPAFVGFLAAPPFTGFFFTGVVVLFFFALPSGSKSLPLSSSLGDSSNRKSSSSLSSGVTGSLSLNPNQNFGISMDLLIVQQYMVSI